MTRRVPKQSRDPKGRASASNPPNRFARLHLEPLDIEPHEDADRSLPTVFYPDLSQTILSKNDSPDLPFTYSINPYRGCEHGCIYCYARPSHEYLGFSAGLDFESKIMIKLKAPRLLDAALRRKSWIPQMVALSGNTDCYQPVERELTLTRQCLAVFLEFRNPVGIVTKNALITRDLDLLRAMAELDLVHVLLSITTLDAALARTMEPRTSTPDNRLRTIADLAAAGVPAGVSIAPVIPGLTDEEIPRILKAAAAAGATAAGYEMLRLPGAVGQLFPEWLNRHLPDRAGKILNRVRDIRGGTLNDARYGLRMSGEGEIAKSIDTLFDVNARRYGLDGTWRPLRTERFRIPDTAQGDLFAG
jgi:DNA repair photolyase